MNEQRGQCTELPVAYTSWVEVHLLLVCWGVDVVIQAMQITNPFVAEMSLVRTSVVIPGGWCGGS